MHKNVFFSLFFALLITSCETKKVYSDYHGIATKGWSVQDTLLFTFQNLDTKTYHQLYFNVRNDENYPFGNLFLIASMADPKGQVVVDTLEYRMAQADGTWLGKGVGSIKESKLWYRENVKLADSGVYIVKLIHAMRKNGSVDGVPVLKGITDVGLEIETKD